MRATVVIESWRLGLLVRSCSLFAALGAVVELGSTELLMPGSVLDRMEQIDADVDRRVVVANPASEASACSAVAAADAPKRGSLGDYPRRLIRLRPVFV